MIDVLKIIGELDGIHELTIQEEITQSIIDICNQHKENRKLFGFDIGIDTTSSKGSDTIYLRIYPESKFKSFLVDFNRRSLKALLKGTNLK